MAHPAVRPLPKLPLPLRGQTRALPLSSTTCSARTSPSTILRHRPPVRGSGALRSPAPERSSDLKRYSPDIHHPRLRESARSFERIEAYSRQLARPPRTSSLALARPRASRGARARPSGPDAWTLGWSPVVSHVAVRSHVSASSGRPPSAPRPTAQSLWRGRVGQILYVVKPCV